MEPRKQFSAETQKQLEEAKYKLLSGPLDLVIEDLRSVAENDEMPGELAKKLRELADELDPALGSLNEVEQEFLDIFFPEVSAGVEFDEADDLSLRGMGGPDPSQSGRSKVKGFSRDEGRGG